uniref:DNA primase large subunit n=1 Tax=Macrostomum lignano TaxID=282301 RepID=A0A1I8GSF4_9PLAT
MEITESKGSSAEPQVRLQFYRDPPSGSEQLDTVQNLCLARLRLLKAVEEVGQDMIKGSKEYMERLKMKLGKLDLGASLLTTSGVHVDGLRFREEIRRDVLSHFLLRLAMCRTEDQRRWFITQETDLFRLRFQLEQNADRCLPIAGRSDLAPELLAATPGIGSDAELATVAFYRAHFTEALDLVRSRRVYLRDGFAYVPETGVVSMATTRFRAHLSHQLAVACRALPYLGEDARLWCSAARLTSWLRPASRPACSICTLPCAAIIISGTLAVDGDKFAKEYAYGIRYNYGKEGKRADFSPYSCVRIITTNQPGQGDSHGCPFRHCGADLLAQRLQAAGISQDQAQGILTRAKDSQYQLACRDYFRAVHKLSSDHEVSINHPNQYYEESRALLLGNGQQQQSARAPVRVTKVKAAPAATAAGSQAAESDWLDETIDQEMSQVDLSAYEA